MSKIKIEANNYDFSQQESCLRTDFSWRIGLREHSIQFISILDKLVPMIHDESLLIKEMKSLKIAQNFVPVESKSWVVSIFLFYEILIASNFLYFGLKIIQEGFLENIREHFKVYKYDFTDNHEQAWNKFFQLITQYMSSTDIDVKQHTDSIFSSHVDS